MGEAKRKRIEKGDYKKAQHAHDFAANPHVKYSLNKGNSWNPLKRFPRNQACFCGSGIKHKKCCAEFVGEFTPTDFAKSIDAQWPEILAGKLTLNVRPNQPTKEGTNAEPTTT